MRNINIICPHCGGEIEFNENLKGYCDNSKLPNGTYVLVPKDKMDKKMRSLKNMGFDVSKFFDGFTSVTSGTDRTAPDRQSYNEYPIDENDDIEEMIKSDGYIEGNHLWRRWIMAQMFRALKYKDGYDAYYRVCYRYDYQWKTLLNEIRAQSKIKDKEELEYRLLYFNETVFKAMLTDYLRKLKKHISNKKYRDKNGNVRIPYYGIYSADTVRSTISYIGDLLYQDDIWNVKTVRKAIDVLIPLPNQTTKCSEWKAAFRGAGAYYTLDNMIKFHGCKLPTTKQIINICGRKSNAKEYSSAESIRNLNKIAKYFAAYESNFKMLDILKDTIAANNFVPAWD